MIFKGDVVLRPVESLWIDEAIRLKRAGIVDHQIVLILDWVKTNGQFEDKQT